MKQLSFEEKEAIRAQLQAYVSRYPSQNKAVNSLGISAATASTILNGRFDNISDEMFLRIRALTAPSRPADWAICETAAFRELTLLFEDAQASGNVSWVVGNAGVGKTTAAHEYAAAHDNAFVISCSEDMRRGDFIREMARVLGIRLPQSSLRDKLMAVTDELRVLERPLLIFDEGDKLMDSVFYYFIWARLQQEGLRRDLLAHRAAVHRPHARLGPRGGGRMPRQRPRHRGGHRRGAEGVAHRGIEGVGAVGAQTTAGLLRHAPRAQVGVQEPPPRPHEA